MKTKWGACSVDARRIWLNLELAKKPARCSNAADPYLVERRHNDRFKLLMGKHLPLWRQQRRELTPAPLAHADWSYWRMPGVAPKCSEIRQILKEDFKWL